ncbi:ComEC/Rec2 family competence protein [Paraflavitalea pollutisoli]|uniref:ComEC/Rec2 family competence protein n=1 Tax=Paraflavitalea pollutisoli TaxID=3034143 RepID=UPI0023EC5B30|nr:ComEC/Rec2 family competence protein [Paraflavitalea sp. H1-2-19X]
MTARLSVNLRFRYRHAPAILLNLLLFASGMLVAWYNNPAHQKNWFGYHYQPGDTIMVRIAEPLTEKAKSYSTIATIEVVKGKQHLHRVKGRLVLYFDKQHLAAGIDYGTVLTFVKTPEPIGNPGNPNAFNYKQYCGFKGVFHQVYLREHNYFVAEKKQIFSVKKLLFDTRKKMLAILRETIPDKKQAGLAEALLIGYKNDLDKPLLQSYINTGLVHIIAISGMHLGLIYALLLFFGSRLPSSWQRWAVPGAILVILWCFVLLTGASPSALRSAIMFSTLLIGSRLPIHQSPTNALAVSAFLLLWYDPWLCFDVGFQLSYAAVLSILLFLRPITGLLDPTNKYLRQVWQLIALTLAAQILTLPISLYHFHQFPNLFLIANLVAVPLSGVILVGEVILCCVAWLPDLASWLGWLLSQMIAWLNRFVEMLDHIPFNTTDNIPFNLPQLLFFYTMIAGFVYWRYQQTGRPLLVSLSAVWAIVAINCFYAWQANRQQEMIIYNTPRMQALDFFAGRQYLFQGDSALRANTALTSFHLQPNRIEHRVKPVSTLPGIRQEGKLTQFGTHTILHIDTSFQATPFRGYTRLPVTMLILTGNPSISIGQLANLFDCSHIIVDGTNSPWKTRTWQQDSRRLGIPCHAVATQGAFVFPRH